MKESESVRLVTRLLAAFPAAKMRGDGRDTLQVYAAMLQDLELADAERAVVECIAECKFFPTVAEIRERVARARVAYQPAELAWCDVISAVRQFGIYRTPEFDNPCTAIAVSNVGWRAICNSTSPGVERAHFIRAYDRALELARAEVTTTALLRHVDRPRLAGVAEHASRAGVGRDGSENAGAVASRCLHLLKAGDDE